MQGGLRGPAFSLGLLLVTVVSGAASSAWADSAGMRFVPRPELLSTVDPQRAVIPAPVRAPASSRTSASEAVGTAKRGAAYDVRGVPKSWPVTLSEVEARKKAEADGKRDAWSEAEVAQARQHCAAILKRIAAVAVYEEPIKQGACGDPAPIRLISLGRKPEVVISPPALVNCDMAEAMHTWLKTGLQPLARQHLGGPIIKIVKMSDYSCRNAYGRARGRLSQHGLANALDIAGFMTAKGDSTMLLADWGMTKRDIRRQVAAAKAKAAFEEKKRIAAERHGQENARAHLREATLTQDLPATTGSLPPNALGVTSGAPAGGVARASVVDGVSRVTVSIPGGGGEANNAAFEMPANRLGGPKPHDVKPPSIVVQTKARAGGAVAEIRKQRFLRGAHTSACGIFGTVLGPEANNAHRNHFHVDLAARKSGAFCQ